MTVNAMLASLSAAEGLTGLVLLIDPPIVVRLLFASEIDGAGVIMSRIAGIALIAMGAACFPGGSVSQSSRGLLTYSSLVMLCLLYVGIRSERVGLLLWPAVVAHALMIGALLWARSRGVAPSH